MPGINFLKVRIGNVVDTQTWVIYKSRTESIGMEELRNSQRFLTDLYGAVSRANLAVIELVNTKRAREEKYVAQALFSDKGQVPTGTDNTTHVSRYRRHDDV